MKALSFILISLLASTLQATAQNKYTSKLFLQSNASSIDVTPGEKLIITTRAGEVVMADTSGTVIRYAAGFTGTNQHLLDRPDFFNADTGFVSGFISNNGKYNIIFRTTDGGRSWSDVNFGMDGWADATFHLPNGEAWMFIAGKGIAYSNDYGKTWSKQKNPEIKQRAASIFFNQKQEGLIACNWNVLLSTNNNGQNWITIPTPLDQGQYRKTDTKSRPAINKAAIYKNYLLCVQENMLFYTRRDTIRWRQLKGYTNFYTDAANSALYFILSDRYAVSMNDALMPIFHEQLPAPGYSSAICSQGNLYIYNSTSATLHKITPDQKIFDHPLFVINTNSSEEQDITDIAYFDNKSYGQRGNSVYVRDQTSPWKHVTDLPWSTADQGRVHMLGPDDFIMFDNGDTIRYFNYRKKQNTYRLQADLLPRFMKRPIISMTFEKGSRGCFHYNKATARYNLHGGNIYKDDMPEEKIKRSTLLTNAPESMNIATVQDFLTSIPNLPKKKFHLADAGFSAKDYEQCKQEILHFKNFTEGKSKTPGAFTLDDNNIDFDLLLSLPDSIRQMSDSVFSQNLYPFQMEWSTTTTWVAVTLVNDLGKVLKIKNEAYDLKRNPFNIYWMIEIDGLTMLTTSYDINKFCEDVFPGFIGKGYNIDALYKIISRLYRECQAKEALAGIDTR